MKRSETLRVLGILACAVLAGTTIVAGQDEDPAANTSPPAGVQLSRASTGMNAIDFTPGSGVCGFNQGQSIGWQFDVDNEVTVIAMAYFDENQDGLGIAHEVAIWDPSGTILPDTNVTIPAGAGAALDGIWRVVTVPATTLPPGTGYIVGALNGPSNDCLSANVSQVVNADLTYFDATFSALGATLERPTNFSSADNGFYGVGFQIATVAPTVPPWGLAMLAAVLALLGLAALRRRDARSRGF